MILYFKSIWNNIRNKFLVLGIRTILLTYDAVAGATRLRSASIYVEIGVSAGAPLTQDARRRVYDVHEMSVRGIKVPGSVVAHVEYDCRVQAGDPADFSRVDEVGRQSCDMSTHAVPGVRTI